MGASPFTVWSLFSWRHIYVDPFVPRPDGFLLPPPAPPLLEKMLRFSSVLLVVAFAAVGSRACTCPDTDTSFYPVAPGTSGPIGTTLRCYYPSISRCQYSTVSCLLFFLVFFSCLCQIPNMILTMQKKNEFASQTTGALLRDSNAGLCRATAPGLTTCPTTDSGGFALGPGSGARGTTLYCTYPAAAELASTRYYCDYSASPVDLPLCSQSDSPLSLVFA